MKKYLWLVTIILLNISSSLYAQEASENLGTSTGTMMGWGTGSCARVIAKADPSETFPIEAISWAQGYLTALSLTLRHNSSVEFDTKFRESGGAKILGKLLKESCMKAHDKRLESIVFNIYRDWGGTALR